MKGPSPYHPQTMRVSWTIKYGVNLGVNIRKPSMAEIHQEIRFDHAANRAKRSASSASCPEICAAIASRAQFSQCFQMGSLKTSWQRSFDVTIIKITVHSSCVGECRGVIACAALPIENLAIYYARY